MPKHVVILGAGISGLSLAWFLKKKSNAFRITILESSSRAGGRIQTLDKDGFLFELGPHSCRSGGAGIETLQLIEQLGLQQSVIIPAKAARQRYLYSGQMLVRVPSNPAALFFSSLSKGLLKELWREWQIPKGDEEDESIESFILRRLGKTCADRFFDPLVSGIFAGDISQLSVQSCFPLLHQWEQNHGSLLKGMLFQKKRRRAHLSPFIQHLVKNSFFSFKNGMETIIKELVNHLEEELKYESKTVQLLPRTQGIDVRLQNGAIIEADAVVSTLPAFVLADLMIEQAAPVSKRLQNIHSASVAVVCLGYHRNVLKHHGFGYLIPSKEQEKILGVVWDSCVFPQHNRYLNDTRLSVMLGGSRMADFKTKSMDDFNTLALNAVAKHLGIHAVPDMIHTHQIHQAIPQYRQGHQKLITDIKQEIAKHYPSLTILGISFEGISINDCISNANKLASSLNI